MTSVSGITEKYVDAGGIRTRYLECGAGPALILVHGGQFGSMGCAEDWLPAIGPLARSFRVIAMDKIGSGYSDNPRADGDYVIGTTVAHLRDFMAALNIPRAHLAGHSRGGYTVVNAAMDYPGLASSLIVVSSATLMAAPNAIYKEWNKQAAKISGAREQWRHRLTANSWSGAHLDDDFLDTNVAIESLPKYQLAKSKMNDGLWAKFRDDLNVKRELLRSRIASNGIPCPLLLTWGYDDPSARLDPTGLEAMRILVPASIRGEFHVFKNAGHYVYREQPERFSSVVGDFIHHLG
ncbi:MAG: alpha/beta fold hydrolase [Burkholderiales bacterium]